MKKVLITLLALLLTVTVAAPGMAAPKAKAPKNICLLTTGSVLVFSMATKKGATLAIGGEKVPMYTIQGTLTVVFAGFPLEGSGYMVDNDFIFSLNSNAYATISAYGAWNVVTETGFVNIIQTNSPNLVTESDYPLEVFDCDSLGIGGPVPPVSLSASAPVDANAMIE